MGTRQAHGRGGNRAGQRSRVRRGRLEPRFGGVDEGEALLDRFPGKDKFIAHLRSSLQQEGLDWETDVKPALGNEIELVWLDFRTTATTSWA